MESAGRNYLLQGPTYNRFSTESSYASPSRMVESGRGGGVQQVSLAELLAARPAGVTEPETWAILCQATQALQDLFLSDGICSRHVPVLSPASVLLSSRGRITFALQRMPQVSLHGVASYAPPEYDPATLPACSDADIEKMLIYSMGCLVRRLALPTHSAVCRLSSELCAVLAAMGRQLPIQRASLMHLLDVISEYSRRRSQQKPFSHIVMDLYRETIIFRHSTPMPDAYIPKHLVPPCSHSVPDKYIDKTIPTWRREELNLSTNIFNSLEKINNVHNGPKERPRSINENGEKVGKMKRRKDMKRNPVKRAASRLYRVEDDVTTPRTNQRSCIGPEFVIRASLPSKQIIMEDSRMGNLKTVTVIMLNGAKIEVSCKPEFTTAGQLFEKIIQVCDITDNYFLGLSILLSGDFVFLPSDVKLSKVMGGSCTHITLYVRIRFFLPSLRGVSNLQSRHLLYLQLRRSLLEGQLPCNMQEMYELAGMALQAEFGDFNEKHESSHYFLLEHYIPEILIGNPISDDQFRKILTETHLQKKGLGVEKSEEGFILLAQSLPNYGAHFYSATLVSKNSSRDVWLCVSAHGLNLYERSGSIVPYNNPLVYEIFKWQDIQTLCYSKHFLCILPHCNKRKNGQKKYKLKMDHKKSYYTFRLASLHHQFFLRLRTEYSSLNSLSQQFGVLLKDIKNEANSLFKLSQNSNPPNQLPSNNFSSSRCKRSKSVHELSSANLPIEEYQNKENEIPREEKEPRKEKRKGVKMGIRAFTNGRRMSRSLEMVNQWEEEKISLESMSRLSNSSDGIAQNDVYVLNSSIRSFSDHFLPDFHESLNQTLLDKLKNLSFADERILKPVTIFKDPAGSLGIQVTEGSDGKVYIQSVVPFGSASHTKNIFKGDQIVSVDGHNLLNLKYSDALQLLKKTDDKVELILSQVAGIATPREGMDGDKLCNIYNIEDSSCDRLDKPFVAMPRSLGLGRRWKGPVKYPVTPVKQSLLPEESNHADNDDVSLLQDEEEQIFI